MDEAVKEKELILDKAREAAHECLEAVQTRVDEKLAEGKKKYMAVQEELNDIVELLNQVQRRFMQSYKAVHTIINSTPESLQDLSEESEEENRSSRGLPGRRKRSAGPLETEAKKKKFWTKKKVWTRRTVLRLRRSWKNR